MNKEELVSTIKEWVKVENEISLLQRELKSRRERKKQISELLLSVMKDNEIDAFDITGGRVLYSQRKTKAPITKKSLMEMFDAYFKDRPDLADDLNEFIQDNRKQVIKDVVRTKYNKKD
tara:strand:+ start:19478 stop:19834 length:357 start_codon:yes stop_codon:yes gene_type:complete